MTLPPDLHEKRSRDFPPLEGSAAFGKAWQGRDAEPRRGQEGTVLAQERG